MRRILSTALAVLALAAPVKAATVTIYFEATEFTGNGLSLLDLTADDTITGSFTFDDSMPNLGRVVSLSRLSYSQARDDDGTGTVVIDGTVYSGTDDDRVVLQDGRRRANDYLDFYIIDSFVGLNEIVASTTRVFSRDTDGSTLRTRAQAPSVATLNAMPFQYMSVEMTVGGDVFTFESRNVFFLTENPNPMAVPLPAGVLILGGGLGGLAMLARRRRPAA